MGSNKEELPEMITEDVSEVTAVATNELEDVELDEQRRTKAEQYSNIMTVIFAGVALTSDGYQNNVFNLINLFFTRIYGNTVFTSDVSARIGNALLIGAIVGQLGFGVIADRFGRKVGLLLTTMLIVVGTILCAAAYGINGDAQSLFWVLTVYRGITGVGVGGEYPCSSTSASEASDDAAPRLRGGVFVMVTNFVLVLGGVFAVCVMLVLLSIFGTNTLEPVWRAAFGIGCILPLSVFYFRLKIANSRRYREQAIKARVPYALALKRYWRHLVASAGCWFLYDFVVFPNGIISSAIINTVVPDNDLLKTAEYQLLLQSLSLPGIVLGAWAVDRIGRKKTMAIGFVICGVLGIIIGSVYEHIKAIPALFVVLYALFLSSANFGPGDCLGLVSAEIYPTAIRGTFYGISAAIGKAGAAIGTQVLVPLQRSFTGDMSYRVIFWVCGAISFLGAALCVAMIPDYSAQSLEIEDRAWRKYLSECGWETEFGFQERDAILERLEREQDMGRRVAI